MNDNAYELKQNDEDLLIVGFSDEVLESAAATGTVAANYTLGSCTGMISCPA